MPSYVAIKKDEEWVIKRDRRKELISGQVFKISAKQKKDALKQALALEKAIQSQKGSSVSKSTEVITEDK